jgi:hypothetical protein
VIGSVPRRAISGRQGRSLRRIARSWHNLLYGSFGPAGSISIDKIPLSFAVQAVFSRVFGFHNWVLPAAIMVTALSVLVAPAVWSFSVLIPGYGGNKIGPSAGPTQTFANTTFTAGARLSGPPAQASAAPPPAASPAKPPTPAPPNSEP